MSNRAVVVDLEAPGRLVIRPVADPVPDRGEAIVRVRAISLNRGEVRRSGMAAAGWRPGWDLAGEVERAAADGSGPRAGARVVGLLGDGSAEAMSSQSSPLLALPSAGTGGGQEPLGQGDRSQVEAEPPESDDHEERRADLQVLSRAIPGESDRLDAFAAPS